MHCPSSRVTPHWRQASPKIGLVALLIVICLALFIGSVQAAEGSGAIAGRVKYAGGIAGDHPIQVQVFGEAPEPVAVTLAGASGVYTFTNVPNGEYTVMARVNVYSDSEDVWDGAVEGWYDADDDGEADGVAVAGSPVTGIDVSVGGPWVPLGGPSMNGGETQALAVDAVDPQVVYAAVKAPQGAGSGRVFRSADSGATWTMIFTPTATVIDLAARDGKVCVTCSDGSSYRLSCSADAGETWTDVDSNQIEPGSVVHISDVAIAAENPDTLLIAGRVMTETVDGEISTVFGSVDDGATWARLLARENPAGQHGAFFSIAEDPSSSGRFFIGGTEASPEDSATTISVIYRVEGGDWASDLTQVYSSTVRSPAVSLAVDPGNGNVVLAATPSWFGDPYLLCSIDGGDTWGEALEGGGAFVAIPTAGHAYAGTGDGWIYASSDGGETWGNGVHINNYCSGYAAGDHLFAGGCMDGVLRSSDNGATWAPSSEGITSLVGPTDITVDPFDAQHLYVAANCGGGWSSADGGDTWAHDPIGCVASYAFDPRREGVVYRGDYAREFGALERSVDGGLTWSPVYTSPIGLYPGSPSEAIVYAIAPAPSRPATIYAAGADQPDGERRHATVVRSTGNGVAGSWTEVLSMTAESWVETLAVHPFDARVVYAGGAWNCGDEGCQGFVQRSTDGGATWSIVFTDTQVVASLAIDHGDPDTLYAGLSSYWIYRSTDGGETWSVARRPPWEGGDVSGNLVVSDPRSDGRVYLAGWGVVLQSADGGATWVERQNAIGPTPQYEPLSLTVINVGDRQTLYLGVEGLWSYTRMAPEGDYRNAIPAVIRPPR